MRADVFRRIGGIIAYQPRNYALLQTDGSFYPKTHHSYVAMYLRSSIYNTKNNKIFKHTERIPDAQDSTETEWASVNLGLIYALNQNETNVNIENDNLGVILGLMLPNKTLKHDYAKYHRHNILKNANDHSQWTAIRWIPRELNNADKLFNRKNNRLLR